MLVRWWGNSLTFTWNFVIGNIFIQRIDVISTKLCRCYKSQIKWIGGGFIGQFKAQQESLWDAYCNYAETIAYIFWWRPQFHNDGDVGDVKSNPVAKDAHAWRPAWKILVSIERIFPSSTTTPPGQSLRGITKQRTDNVSRFNFKPFYKCRMGLVQTFTSENSLLLFHSFKRISKHWAIIPWLFIQFESQISQI